MHVHLSTVRGLKFDFFVDVLERFCLAMHLAAIPHILYMMYQFVVDVLERFCLAIHLAAIPHIINISPDTVVYFFQDRLKISGGNEMNER